MVVETNDEETEQLIARYVARLNLPTDDLRITTDRQTFERWLGRRVSSSIGGAYAFSSAKRAHLVLINLPRIDRSQPRALEIVVAEELIHMRDRLDGDLRRHAKHGYDRIAVRVAAMTGASLDEIRRCLVPVERRPLRYLYACPKCQHTVRRRRRGVWSCGRCSRRFDPKLVLRLVADDLSAD
ncbi:MAG TPA: hypothetical protein VH482_19095 [Thermomicrobiales bacterium]|jgi:ribosomal protein L37AE/L43A